MRRINEVMREVIGSAIASDLEDPRIGFVTVTSVKTSPDLRSARVYVSVLGDEDEREQTLAGAARPSHGMLQAAIAREVRIKHTPTLKFHYDESLERGVRLTQLLEGDCPRTASDASDPTTVTTDLDRVVEELRAGERFLLTTHEGPDGDALGSLLAMHQAARASSARTR